MPALVPYFFRVCGVTVAHFAWDDGEQFNSDIFYHADVAQLVVQLICTQ